MNKTIEQWSAMVPTNVDSDDQCVDLVRAIVTDAQADLQEENKRLRIEVARRAGEALDRALEFQDLEKEKKVLESKVWTLEKCVKESELEQKALRERLEKTDMAVAILRDALKKRDQCEDCGGKGFSYVEIEGEAEPDPCECSRWADLVIESTATIDGVSKIGEGWLPPRESGELLERLKQTEEIIVALHQLVGEKLTANPANIQAAVERLIQAKEKAEAAAAEMRTALLDILRYYRGEPLPKSFEDQVSHALSSECGQPLMDKLKALETEKAELTALLSLARTCNKKRRETMKAMEEILNSLPSHDATLIPGSPAERWANLKKAKS